MPVIFPDIEKLIVSHLNLVLVQHGETNVRVGTIKASAGSAHQEKEVVVTAGYTSTEDVVRRSATATLEVYADTYSTASSLALLVAALITSIVGDDVKRAEVTLGPVRTTEASQQEKRSMTVEFIVKGADI